MRAWGDTDEEYVSLKEDEVTDTLEPKFDVEVELTGQDGNAFMILGLVQKGLRKAGATPEDIKQFHDEATSGDYDHLLQTAMRWVHVL